jgi:outer membrane protein OmpA-like peptidoglycan-associated protein
MKRLLTTTTALALAISPVAPLPVSAQSLTADGAVIGDDGTVLCTPTAEAPCDLEAITKEVQQAAEKAAGEAAAQAEAEARAAEEAAAAAAAAEAEQQAQAAAQAEAERQAAEAAAQAEAQARAAEEAAAAAAAAEQQAQAAAQAEAERQAAEAAAQAEAEARAAEEAAAAAAAAEAEQQAQAAAQAEAERQAAEAVAEAERQAAEAAAAQAAAEQKAAEEAAAQAAAEQAAQDAATADPEVTDPNTTQTTGADGNSQPAPVMIPDQTPGQDQAATPTGPSDSINDQPNVEAAGSDPNAATQTNDNADQTANDQQPVPEDPPVPVAEQTINPEAVTTPPSEEEVKALTDLLAQPEAVAADAVVPTMAAAAAAVAATDTTAAPAAPTVSETVLTSADTRASSEDFATTASGKKKNKDKGLSDFEKAGLVALGALAVGVLLSNRDQVVSNTGDRVVVQRSDGNYAVYKDDDALLRQPGSTVRTETYRDGSTRTTVTRDDGTSVVTIRDATGRVLKRSAYDTRGREIVLIDDLAPESPVVVSTLPKPTAPVISTQGTDVELAAALAAIQARDIGRTFSLRQVRDIKEVRALAATVDVDNITFDTGSAAITAAQAENLAALGSFLKKMLAKNPGEIFLIEGHTDAVGSAASNLALSDRRAESVALALTEYFGVPPENLVVQGYGEADLRIPTDRDERLNRRVAVRVITPLLTVASN